MAKPHGDKKPNYTRRAQGINPYTAKILKPPSQQHLKDTLRHAVSHRDDDAFEDYDEWNAK